MTESVDAPSTHATTAGRRQPAGARRRLTFALVVTPVLLAGLALLAARPPARGETNALRVTAPGPNAAIERTALAFLDVRSASPAAAGLRRLYNRPRVVGIVHPRRNVVVVGVVDEVRLAGAAYRVYSVVTLLNRNAAGYSVDASGTTCDGIGEGIVFAVPLPGDDIAVALGLTSERTPPVGSHAVAPPGAMHAWTDTALRTDQVVAVHGGEPTMWHECPGAGTGTGGEGS